MLKIDIVIYAQGGILDLVIASSLMLKQVTECYIEPNLYVTNDHKTILTCIKIGNSNSKKASKRKFQLNKMNEKLFFGNLKTQKNSI